MGLAGFKGGAFRSMVRGRLQQAGGPWSVSVARLTRTMPTTLTSHTRCVQGSSDHPATTIVGVTGLVMDGLLIEIETTVVLRE
jgi:enamine deaminase RidA (YjgF/YER057c/UK114 family)